jgi:hypothetical protein
MFPSQKKKESTEQTQILGQLQIYGHQVMFALVNRSPVAVLLR